MSNSTAYLPWAWTIVSSNQNLYTCPSVSTILTTFAIVNVVVSFISIVFGNRYVVKFVTCGCMGKPGTKSWTYMWIFPIGLNLFANAVIAWIIKHATGYVADFKVWELMLFLLARPRLSWIILGFFAGRGKQEVESPIDMRRLSRMNGSRLSYQPLVAEQMQYTAGFSSNVSLGQKHVDRPWMNAFLSQFIAEVLLQLASLYIMGRTAHFAVINGFYKLTNSPSLPRGAHMMYAGALYYLIAGSLSLIIAIIAIIVQGISTRYEQSNAARVIRVVCVLLLLGSTFLGSWLFWAGFVQLAGHQ